VKTNEPELVRELGAFSVFSITVGSMIGAGIFILPGLAISQAGGAGAMLAYLLASLIALTAALSIIELAVAMPRAGGAYYFLSRSMGPIAGSMAGLGSSAALTLKGSFALIGFALYLSAFTELTFAGAAITLNPVVVALVMCLFLTVVNTLGTRHAGSIQRYSVAIVMVTLTLLAIFGLFEAKITTQPLFADKAVGSILATSGLVYVSFIGMQKSAAVAGEVKNPERNFPLGIISAMVLVTIMYMAIVYVVAGTLKGNLEHTLTPVADVALVLFGTPGFIILTALGMLATLSMANAAILASSRYPFAMANDKLMIRWFAAVHPRFQTPHRAILSIGVIMIVMIATLDVHNLAELASAFNLLLSALLNVAVIIMRLSKPSWYKPKFRSPGYPVVQILGIAGCFLLISQLGIAAQLVAGIVVLAGAGWYYVYARRRTSLKGLIQEAVRQPGRTASLVKVEEKVLPDTQIQILHPLTNPHHEWDILYLASLLHPEEMDAAVHMIRLKELPSQTPLLLEGTFTEEGDRTSEERIEQYAEELGVKVDFSQYRTHSSKSAVVSLALEQNSDLILLDWTEEFSHSELHKSDVDWILQHSPCDVVVLKDLIGLKNIQKILVTSPRDILDPLTVDLADRLALSHSASLKFLRVISLHASEDEVKSKESYLRELVKVTKSESSIEVVMAPNDVNHIVQESDNYDLIVIGTGPDFALRDRVFGSKIDRIAFKSHCSVMVVMQLKQKTRLLRERAYHAISGRSIAPRMSVPMITVEIESEELDLTDAQLIKIIMAYSKGKPIRIIAQEFNITREQVMQIILEGRV